MATIKYLPIKASEVPIIKIFTIGGVTRKFLFQYNARGDFFTVTIYNEDDEIIYTSKIVYGNALITASVDGLDIAYPILPTDENEFLSSTVRPVQEVNADTLGKSVFLYFDDSE